MTKDFQLKMAVISGASRALKLKSENIRWTDEKVLQKINKEIEVIIDKLEE